MRKKLPVIVVVILFAAAISSCTKTQRNLPAVTIIGNDSGKTIVLQQGESLVVTLSNPGDGGYQFDAPVYNSSILKFKSHTRNLPAPSNAVGDFGSDTWEFSAAQSGSTSINISASRNPGDVVVMIADTVSVK